MMKTVKIKKYSGELQDFDMNKLINSLRRSQADENLVQHVARNIVDQVEEGMTTKKIYQMAFNMLKSRSRISASKYNLKKSLMELGSTGFPFEKLVGKLMEFEGFNTQVGVIVQGDCVSHEIDVIAEKENNHYMIECKYHNSQGRFCNVKTPLYVQSRFVDVKQRWKSQVGHDTKLHRGGLYTNTRFTTDAIQYGTCVDLMLVSWDYPPQNSLKARIDKAGLYPLTALATLTKTEKRQLLDKGIVLCKEVYENPILLEQLGINESRQRKILDDSLKLCSAINTLI
ncbi:restriction endonuclease [Myroides ceti]|uniref:ATP cone domain-containing protein n=3 Tax=Bacteroidota TaxID=976 RepID=A0A1H6KDK9_9FLAO|nr:MULTISPECIES: restriction endonuclease [Bacteroidota]MCC2599447.1 restriction endonuclease [Sphingobacterium sp. FBM7-1]MDN3707270.1 restriction endonuclease [Paenimyroides ceti]MDN3708958.1 restriction endonuclease [Paenimyroides ceti]SEH71600.1 ATP cone domain-containing protein [Paenimyroides aquimaris]